MNFGSYLRTSARAINLEIDEFFQEWNKHVQKISPKLLSLGKLFASYCDGGKRLRGTLVKIGYELTGSGYTREVLKPAAAFEIFQTAILAHDDIIDLSLTRRGKPTLYRTLGGDHHGISQTICLGDLGFFLAEKLILESNFSAQRKNKAAASFVQTVLDTALGEMLDVELPCLNGAKNEEDILTVFRLKTARYTIVGPLYLGAILGGAEGKLLGELEELGEKLGVAFQIQDDILGVFGNEDTLGKSVTSDIEEGKQTLLIAFAEKHASVKQKKTLDCCYGRGKIGSEELGQVREVFISSGARDYSQKKAAGLVKEAKGIIEEIKAPEDKKQLLSQMADFIIGRNK